MQVKQDLQDLMERMVSLVHLANVELLVRLEMTEQLVLLVL